MTPEEIEALAPLDVVYLKNLAKELHEAAAPLLETPLPAQEFEDQENIRIALNLKLSESISAYQQQITDLKAIVTELRIVKSYLAADRKRIESRKIAGFVADKAERERTMNRIRSDS